MALGELTRTAVDAAHPYHRVPATPFAIRAPNAATARSLPILGGDDRARALVRLEALLVAGADIAPARRLAAEFELRFVPAGDQITPADPEAAARIGVMLSGFAKCPRASLGTDRTFLSIVYTRDWFEPTRLGGNAKPPTAMVDSWFASLPKPALFAYIERFPEAAAPVFNALTTALEKSAQTIAALAFNDVPGRMAALVLELARNLGTPYRGTIYVDHGLNQTELGQAVGCSRETANKAIADLVKRDILRIDGRTFVLRDLDCLAARARH